MLRLTFLFLLLNSPAVFAANDSALLVLKKMHDTYSGKWYKTLRFVQRTEVWINDSLVDTQTWYESIAFPDKFRIDIEELYDGRSLIFRNDSLYDFLDGKLQRAGKDQNFLLFQLGGMYFAPFDTVVKKFRPQYDLSRFHSSTLNGRPVYVIGSLADADSTDQLWIDKEHLYPVRMITFTPPGYEREDAYFEGQKKLKGGWCETKITFARGKDFKQVEYYNDCEANVKFDPALFDPKKFGEGHWYKPKKNERRKKF